MKCMNIVLSLQVYNVLSQCPGLVPFIGKNPSEEQPEQKPDEAGAAEGYVDDKENRSALFYIQNPNVSKVAHNHVIVFYKCTV